MELSKENLKSTLASLQALPDQIADILEFAKTVKIPAEYAQVDKIVVSGMGGSNLGARILSAVFADRLTVPIIISAEYDIPNFVNEKTLFVLSSYSGSTEETLASYKPAKEAGAKCLVITSEHPANKLLELAKAENLPYLSFIANHNPSNQPRLAVGYSCFALAGILRQLGLLDLHDEELNQAIEKLRLWDEKLSVESEDNEAIKITRGLTGKQIILVAGEFLAGNIHTLRNQINENAKNFASYLILPDLNHHAMEGLAKPDSNANDLVFVFFDSKLYHERVQKRSKLTKQIVAKNNIAFVDILLAGESKLEQSLEVLQLGAWITIHLAIANQVNPLEIPWVDWFKKELA